MTKIEYLSEPAKVSMSDEWYDFSKTDHFWMKWRFEIVRKYIEGLPDYKNLSILEVGCGNGINIQLFEKYLDVDIDGCDLNVTALEKIAEIKGRKLVYNIHDLNPDFIGKYDIIILFDVIEHIKDDDAFISDTIKHLKTGGRIVLNVPAHRFLYSRYDKIMGHERRYCKNELLELLERNNLNIEKMEYWGFFMVPVLLLRKLVLFFIKEKNVSLGFNPPNATINKLFLGFMRIELFLFGKPPSGTSLFAAGKKVNY